MPQKPGRFLAAAAALLATRVVSDVAGALTEVERLLELTANTAKASAASSDPNA
jgi:hypothetical protein